jgi:ribosomal protein S12 methylthiotransferase
VDAWFGTRDLPRLLKTLRADYKKELVGERLLTTPAHYAYLKIAEGCDRPCAFCAIPLMRGKHVSTPIEDLVKSAEALANQGVRELILIAQDLTYYGLDIYKERRLAELVRALEGVEGIDWIRLHYAFPSGFPMDVIDVMAESKKVCDYLDMPLQHASDSILKSMRRGITQEKTESLLADIRARVPGIAIRTTLIVGFPGETEDDHANLLDWIGRMKFERLGCFTYSHEENTHAYNLEDDVPEEVKKKRVDEVMELQAGISEELNLRHIGKVFKVMIDRCEGGFWLGRTEYDSPDVDNEVRIPVADDLHLRVGDFVKVKITGATAFDLDGELA